MIKNQSDLKGLYSEGSALGSLSEGYISFLRRPTASLKYVRVIYLHFYLNKNCVYIEKVIRIFSLGLVYILLNF